MPLVRVCLMCSTRMVPLTIPWCPRCDADMEANGRLAIEAKKEKEDEK